MAFGPRDRGSYGNFISAYTKKKEENRKRGGIKEKLRTATVISEVERTDASRDSKTPALSMGLVLCRNFWYFDGWPTDCCHPDIVGVQSNKRGGFGTDGKRQYWLWCEQASPNAPNPMVFDERVETTPYSQKEEGHEPSPSCFVCVLRCSMSIGIGIGNNSHHNHCYVRCAHI